MRILMAVEIGGYDSIAPEEREAIANFYTGDWCDVRLRNSWSCTRPVGHLGDHVASTSRRPYFRWKRCRNG